MGACEGWSKTHLNARAGAQGVRGVGGPASWSPGSEAILGMRRLARILHPPVSAAPKTSPGPPLQTGRELRSRDFSPNKQPASAPRRSWRAALINELGLARNPGPGSPCIAPLRPSDRLSAGPCRALLWISAAAPSGPSSGPPLTSIWRPRPLSGSGRPLSPGGPRPRAL